MIVLTLLEKIYTKNKQKNTQLFQEGILSQLSKLKVKIIKADLNRRGWLQVEIAGEDELVAANYLKKRYGLAPIHINKINPPLLIRGRIINAKKIGNGIHVDVGVMYPREIDGLITLNKLRSQLTDGKKLSIDQIRNLFCLHEHLPLEVLLTKIPRERNKINAELTQSLIETFYEWVRWQFDRIIILGVDQTKVKYAIYRAKVRSYLNKIEKLGFFENSLICKIGVDAPGIIFKIGKHLKNTPMYVFSPRRIMAILDTMSSKRN